MKNYFDLKLSGSKLFPYFMIVYIASVIYAMALLNAMSKMELLQQGMIGRESMFST